MLSLGLSICSPAVWGNGAFVPSNAETAVLIAALTGSYPKLLKQAWDDAIGASKADGSWADWDVLYPKGAIPGTSAANIADGYLNWKAPGSAFTLTPVNSPTNGNGYWQGDGTSSRLRTQYTPSTNGVKYTLNDASMWIWNKSIGTSVGDAGNSAEPALQLYIRYFSNNNCYGRINQPVAGEISVGNINGTLGLYGVQRRAASDVRLFKNGVQAASGATSSTGLPTAEQWILGSNSTLFSVRQIAFAAWGASQQGREAAIYSRWQTVLTAAGTI